ncbi:MAG: hypothetical protein IKD77_00845 [Bacilli bacterium]|nr:hypothetical protein [Bacilli bacterium]
MYTISSFGLKINTKEIKILVIHKTSSNIPSHLSKLIQHYQLEVVAFPNLIETNRHAYKNA